MYKVQNIYKKVVLGNFIFYIQNLLEQRDTYVSILLFSNYLQIIYSGAEMQLSQPGRSTNKEEMWPMAAAAAARPARARTLTHFLLG